MRDVQNSADDRHVYLNEVGIKDFKYPVEIQRQDGSWYASPAVMSLRVDLPENQKGTHMSRFVEILQDNSRFELAGIKDVLEKIREKQDAVNSYFDMEFDWFVEKESPVSKKKSLNDVHVSVTASLVGDTFDFKLAVDTPVTTLCPCSKEISAYSAHNQRANVIIMVNTCQFIWIEDLVKISEEAASSPVFSLLKRPDEKYVTEYAYDHPKFVEDVCRDVKLRLDELIESGGYSVEVISHESIHNHQAYAKVVKKA